MKRFERREKRNAKARRHKTAKKNFHHRGTEDTERNEFVMVFRRILIIGGIVFTVIFTCLGMLGWLGIQDYCTGTGSLGYNFSILCNSGSFVLLFLIGNFFLLLGLIFLLMKQQIKPLIRYAALTLFIIYGIWVILSPYGIWNSPFFMTRHYPPGIDPKCLECPSIMTATP